MALPRWLDKSIQQIFNTAFALIPQPAPTWERLATARLIAHRGAHDKNRDGRIENTLPAFEHALEKGAWGIEFDIRWTADNIPVVHHDQMTTRLFQKEISIHETTFAELRASIPQIPRLDEVTQLATSRPLEDRPHLMIEVKHRKEGFTPAHVESLRTALSRLTPGRDYHVLSLFPEVFKTFVWLETQACLLVAELNVTTLTRVALEGDYAGLAGHYALLTPRIQHLLEQEGLRVGTGFVASRNSLFREMNRGVEWIFTDDIVKVQAILNGYRTRAEKDRVKLRYSPAPPSKRSGTTQISPVFGTTPSGI